MQKQSLHIPNEASVSSSPIKIVIGVLYCVIIVTRVSCHVFQMKCQSKFDWVTESVPHLYQRIYEPETHLCHVRKPG